MNNHNNLTQEYHHAKAKVKELVHQIRSLQKELSYWQLQEHDLGKRLEALHERFNQSPDTAHSTPDGQPD